MSHKTGQAPKYLLTWNDETKGVVDWARDPRIPENVSHQTMRNRCLSREKDAHCASLCKDPKKYIGKTRWHNATDEEILFTPPMTRKEISRMTSKQHTRERALTPEELTAKIQAFAEAWGLV